MGMKIQMRLQQSVQKVSKSPIGLKHVRKQIYHMDRLNMAQPSVVGHDQLDRSRSSVRCTPRMAKQRTPPALR